MLVLRDENGDFYPLALFGFEKKENLFLDDSGWHAPYVPAMIRREPFMIGFQASKELGDAEHARMLSLDMDHPRVNTETGEVQVLKAVGAHGQHARIDVADDRAGRAAARAGTL